jgi:hypothetical protein
MMMTMTTMMMNRASVPFFIVLILSRVLVIKEGVRIGNWIY